MTESTQTPRSATSLRFEGGWEYAKAPESTETIVLQDRYLLFIDGDFVEPTFVAMNTTALKTTIFFQLLSPGRKG